MRKLPLTVAAFALPLFLMAQPARSADDVELTDPVLLEAVAEAEQTGRMLWLYDQAAWHATDALLSDVDASAIESPRGYVVLAREEDAMLDTIFVVEREGVLREFARYTVDQSKVVSGGLVQGDLPALSPLSQRMMAVRDVALDAMVGEGYGLCSKSNPNTIMLPPDSLGNIAFYLLASTQDASTYPVGGHFRADVGPDGKVVSTRRYMNTCFDLPTAPQVGPDGEKGHAGVSYLLGDTPSEIHVFVGYHMPTGFMVVTSRNRKLWQVENGKIALLEEGFGI